ncbi:MAG TPA: hypothetical protein ENN80_02855 [Candidatus Hydrogenedentes bacterium]|nr:hypothetical protein [Candidatus Hydrogenedentota bacterium]
MGFKGHIEGNVVVLDESVDLPEGTVVEVLPVTDQVRPTIAERFKKVIGVVDDLPEDMARNHDHYIHGTPKRCNSSR